MKPWTVLPHDLAIASPTCAVCGYDLSGLHTRVPCPECGSRERDLRGLTKTRVTAAHYCLAFWPFATLLILLAPWLTTGGRGLMMVCAPAIVGLAIFGAVAVDRAKRLTMKQYVVMTQGAIGLGALAGVGFFMACLGAGHQADGWGGLVYGIFAVIATPSVGSFVACCAQGVLARVVGGRW